MGADEREHEAAVGSVVLQYPLGQRRTVDGAAPDHAVQTHLSRHRGVTGVGTADVAASGRLESRRIVALVQEGVTSVRVGAEGGVVGLRGQRQGSAAAPASHDLCGDQFFVLGAGGVVLQVAAELGDVLVELAEDRVAAVASQHGRLGGLDTADLVRVAEDELTGLQGYFQLVGPGYAAAFDGRMADPVAIAEVLGLGGQRIAVLPPYRSHAGEPVVGGTGPVDGRFQVGGVGRDRCEYHMDVGAAQRRFPVLGAAVAHIAQRFGAGGHPLPELPGERVQRGARHAQRLQAATGDGHTHPHLSQRADRVRRGGYRRTRAPHQLPPITLVVDAEDEIGRRIRRRPRTEHPALDVAEFQRDVRAHVHR